MIKIGLDFFESKWPAPDFCPLESLIRKDCVNMENPLLMQRQFLGGKLPGF
jgi:hypothetical protein